MQSPRFFWTVRSRKTNVKLSQGVLYTFDMYQTRNNGLLPTISHLKSFAFLSFFPLCMPRKDLSQLMVLPKAFCHFDLYPCVIVCMPWYINILQKVLQFKVVIFVGCLRAGCCMVGFSCFRRNISFPVLWQCL